MVTKKPARRPPRAPGSRPRRQKRSPAPTPRARAATGVARSGGVTVTEVAELDALRREIERTARTASPLRWNANPDEVRRSVAQLVLTLVEFIRNVLERQAIRRMEAGTLTDQQTEDVGVALMKLEEAVREIAAQFGIAPDELNLDVGPLGKLM
jgi:hypothetical protein